MLHFIKGDILDIKEGIICQQVNCQGVMGSGLAKAILEKYPRNAWEYKNYCADRKPQSLLGEVNLVKVIESGYYSSTGDHCLYVANIFGQLNYGRENIRYTNYAALFKGLIEICNYAMHFERGTRPLIYIPKNIGCELAHGDWNIVEAFIDSLSEIYINVDIYIVEKEN